MRSLKSLLFLLCLLLAVPLATGCGDAPDDPADAGNGGRPDAGERDASDELPDWDAGPSRPDAGGRDAGFNPDAACVSTVAEATVMKKPVDIIFLIDNSASMNDEIEAVQNNINNNFATIIGESEIDYRVIVVGLHGPTSNGNDNLCRICVEAPLSSTSCNPVPSQPGLNPPVFFHYNVELRSHDSVCKFLESLTKADSPFDFAPNGLKEWLRPNAHKHFVELSDDGLMCTPPGAPRLDDLDDVATGESVAQKFDALLLAKSPEQFGTAEARKYTFHSIINLEPKANATEAYGPEEPMQPNKCDNSSFVGPGTGYQALSRLTGGLRFPICEKTSYDAVFREIAQGVIEGAVVDCEYPVPQPPPGRQIDLSTVVIGYTPGTGGAQQLFKQVGSVAECASGRFYIESEVIKLCPDTCSTVQADDFAKVQVLYGCKIELN